MPLASVNRPVPPTYVTVAVIAPVKPFRFPVKIAKSWSPLAAV